MPDLEGELQRLFGIPLAAKSFELRAASPSVWSYCAVSSTAPSRYVQVRMSLDPRDRPWQVTVRLGEGSLDFPEADWNGLPLWLLVKEGTGSVPTYSFSHTEDVPAALASAAADLFVHAGDFLSGDVAPFRRARAELNKSREPYVVRRPDGSAPEPLPDVLELKRRFSVE